MKKVLQIALALIFFIACKKESPNNSTILLNRVDHVIFTKDNGLLIAGVFNNKYTIIKASSAFGMIWTRNNFDWGNTYSSNGWEAPFYNVQFIDMFQKDDGSFVCFANLTQGAASVFSSTLAISFDQQGYQIKKSEIDFAINNAVRASDGCYLLLGYKKVIKMDGYLNVIWEKECMGADFNGYKIVLTNEGGFAITGSYQDMQIFLKKFDLNGTEISSHLFKHNDDPFDESGFDIIQLNDKGFLIAGRAGNDSILNNMDCQVIRTNSEGEATWIKRFGITEYEFLSNIVSSVNDQFVFQGFNGADYSKHKSFLVKTDTYGNILDSCSFNVATFIWSPLNYYVKYKNSDPDHVQFSKIEPSRLFNK